MAVRAEANITAFFQGPAGDSGSLAEVFLRLTRNSARTMKEIEGYYRALFEMNCVGMTYGR